MYYLSFIKFFSHLFVRLKNIVYLCGLKTKYIQLSHVYNDHELRELHEFCFALRFTLHILNMFILL